MASRSTENVRPAGLPRLALLLVFILMGTSSCAYVARVSQDGAGADPDARSIDPKTSADGQFVVFASDATNLVPGDANAEKDIFVRDNAAGTTELISESINGGSANGVSGQPDISDDGRYVVYWSFADDLVPGDSNGGSDVFWHDRQTGATERVSVDSAGNQVDQGSLGGSVSNDGRYIAFYTAASIDPADTNNGSHDVYRHDRLTGDTQLISKSSAGSAAGSSFVPVITDGGGEVVFHSSATNLVANDTNGKSDVYVYVELEFIDLILSPSFGGNGHSYVGDATGGGLSGDVVFTSSADNLVPGDTNGVADVFHWQINQLSATIDRISDGDAPSGAPTINAAGTQIAYESEATNLQEPGASPADTNGVSDIYLWTFHPVTPTTQLMSQTRLEELPDGASFRPSISADGTAVAYQTTAANLGFTDTNGAEDIVIRPTLDPQIDTVTGTLTAGQTSTLSLTGRFTPQAIASLGGNGVTSATVDSASFGAVDLTVTLDPAATQGPRALTIWIPAPQLGAPPGLGSADQVTVQVSGP
jgi:Tol biopolymer transport system component